MQKNHNKFITFIYIIFAVISLTFIISCGMGGSNNSDSLSKSDAEIIFNKAVENIPDFLYLGDKIELKEKIDGADISYTFGEEGYFDKENKVIKDDFQAHKSIKLEVKISNHTFTKTIRIHQQMEGYFQKVIEYISSKFPSGIYKKDANFYYQYPGDSELKITYKSLNPEYVTDDGKRITHEYDEEVTMQCILEKNGQRYTHDIKFYSMGIDYDERMQIAVKYINDFMNSTDLSEGTVLPTEHPLYGGRFRWISEDPIIIYDYKTIHLPKEAETTHLICEVMYGSTEYRILKYQVELDARPSTITDEMYVVTFLETVLASTKDYLTLYDGTKANINTEYLIDENKKEVLNSYYTDVVRPAIPQDKLDALLYEGYKMPNEENILWIVVHETGMSYAGDDALLLAKYQYNIAYGSPGREASWGYTVDEKSIYQSFPDTYRLWHATDGKTIGGGNTNGIGIEMCVNSDGIYNVSMLNNAKLMAGLLYEYDLGMMNMKQHSDFYEYKSCPEIMKREKRWYEYLTLIAREYISQTVLSQFDISYEIDVPEMQVESIYDFTSLEEGQTVNIKVTINQNIYYISTIKK